MFYTSILMSEDKLSKAVITRRQILNAAEKLIVEKGYESASMRDITQLAGVNLAAVNYHFGSKDALIAAVLKRRLGAINKERLEKLDALEARAAGKPVRPSQLIYAFFGSLVAHAGEDDHDGNIYLKILEQTMLSPSDFVTSVVAQENALVFERYRKAFFKAMPDVPEEEILWRFQFMLGATSYAISGIQALLEHTENIDTSKINLSDKRLRKRLLSFLLGGLYAPLPKFRETNQD